MPSPEKVAREEIDKLLTAAGWVVCNAAEANITGHRGVASVTSDATAKDHFVIVDAVGVSEQDKTDSRSMEQKPTVSIAQEIVADLEAALDQFRLIAEDLAPESSDPSSYR